MMKIKSYIIDLSEQMAVCDANYIRLLKLLGSSRSFAHRVVSFPHLGRGSNKEQVSVVLEVLEEFKYTSTISIKQVRKKVIENIEQKEQVEKQVEKIEGEHSPAQYSAPEMIIRVYHDAKTAEVTSYQNHKYFKAIYQIPNQFMYQCDEKEQLNLFLAEWLNLCINEGLSNPEELQLEKLTCL